MNFLHHVIYIIFKKSLKIGVEYGMKKKITILEGLVIFGT